MDVASPSRRRLALLEAKSQETRKALLSTSGREPCASLDDEEVNRALEEDARFEQEAFEEQERLEALLNWSEGRVVQTPAVLDSTGWPPCFAVSGAI